MKTTFLLFLFFCFAFQTANAQSKPELARAKKMYEGTWVNKKAHRYLTFYFDDDVDYVTINDWTGRSERSKNESIDAYKAFVKGKILILQAENSDHHASYSEIKIVSGKLIYRSNTGLNFKDNFLSKTQPIDTVVFERMRE